MSFKKLIGTLLASTMMVSAFASVANAAVTFTYDEGYYIDNVDDVADRTPYIETSVKKLTSEEVVALQDKVTGISNKKLKATAYGNTATWDVYEVTGTVKGVGQLAVGYDPSDNAAYVKLKAIDAGMDFSPLTALGAKGTAWDAAIANAVETNTGTAWTLKNDGNKGGCFLQLLDAYPNEGETAEDNIRDVDFGYKLYIVIPAGTTKTLSFDTADASVQYNIANGDEGYNGELIVNKIATRSSNVVLEESAPPVTTYTYTFRTYDDNGTGTPIATSTLDAGDAVVAPTAPTRTGYTFVGWATSAGGAAVTIDTTATADTTYYAVYSKDPVPVTSVSLDKSELTFKLGGAATQTLTATVDPSDADVKTVEWSTSDSSVATVENGVVTAVGAGKATITVASTENSEKSATCTVKVNPADVASANFKGIANGTSLEDLTGKPVDASKNYGAGRINADISTGEFTYKVVAVDDAENEKTWDLPSGLEVAGNVNFIAIVKSATHVITNIFLRATVK